MTDLSPPTPPASPLLDHCPPGLPAASYRDPATHAAEIAAIWAREWVYVGRTNDLRPGALRRVTVAGENVVLARDRGGRIAAFHNACRHRGAELCPGDERELRGRLIVCPYHQWAYDLDGRLTRRPRVSATPDFRAGEHGLFPVALREWNGCLFACLADAPPDLDAAPDLGPAALDAWPMAGLVTGHTLAHTLECNWKVFWENYSECLHCPGVHPALVAMVPVYGRGIMAANEAADWTPGAPAGANLRPGAESWTVSGRACGPAFPGLGAAERAEGFRFVTLWPSLYLCAHVDYVRAVSMRPLGPEHTELRVEWLFPPETLAAPGFDLADVVEFAATVLREDGAACEANQRGLRSRRFERGALAPQEYEIHRFHEWVRARCPASDPSAGAPR
jgi:Rieske 2Fe-2S family protein